MNYLLSSRIKIIRIIKNIRRKEKEIYIFFSLFTLILSSILSFTGKINILISLLGCTFFIIIPTYIIVISEYKKKFELLSFLVGTYLLLFTISWGKYEFSIDRENQMLTILTALMTTDNRKNFSPLLSSMTRLEVERKPNIFSFCNILYSAADIADKSISENSQKIVGNLLIGYKDWSNSNFDNLNITNMRLAHIDFTNSKLLGSNFMGANLYRINFTNTQLYNANFRNAIIQDCLFDNADLRKSSFEGARIYNTSFKKAKLEKTYLFKTSFHKVTFEGADMRHSSFKKKGATKLESLQIKGKIYYPSTLENLLYNVKTLHGAQLPIQVEKNLKEKYPVLFENPDNKKSNK